MKSIRKIIAGLTLVSTMLLAVACKKDDHDENGNDDVNVGDNSGNGENTEHVHDFSDWVEVQAPGCTTNGVEKRLCTGCSAVEERTVTMLGHSFVNGACEKCSTPCNHSYGDWYGNTASCTAPGEEHRDCSVCGYVDSRETKELPHTYVDRTCVDCGKKDYTLPAQPLA